MMEFSWQVMGAPSQGPELSEFLVRMALYWYSHPLELADNAPPGSYVILNYDEMVREPATTVTDIYQRFDSDRTPSFINQLNEATERARNYQSCHVHDLESLGLNRAATLEQFVDIFERFSFNTV